ncbi:MAG: SDR family NAD(P)-dependent oxidoreductase [Gemmataceae bacterium]
MELHDLIVLTSGGINDPSVAVAAARAGARGILDFEHASASTQIELVISQAILLARRPIGVKIGTQSAHVIDKLLAVPRQQLDCIILAGGDHTLLAEWMARFRTIGVEIIFEALSLDEVIRAHELGVDGLILKGHEAGGRVGADTSFILLQKWRRWAEQKQSTLPIWVQGGVGLHTVAACQIAGARGVVLDSQLLLTRESPLGESLRQRVRVSDGSESVVLGESRGEAYRIYARQDWAGAQDLAGEEERLSATDLTAAERLNRWRSIVTERVGTEAGKLWMIGPDAAQAAALADQFVTTAGVLQAFERESNRLVEVAGRVPVLAPESELARRHGTKYPILQGPMTRVSDTAEFAAAVADGGGLPFLALALLRRAEVEKLLLATQKRLGDRPWGIGILGFVPQEIRQEQLAAVRSIKPPFAIIAGGRPDQARELSQDGVTTYLHVPSPGLLRTFLRDGARHFIFEGRECGGHVGPRSSFVLSEQMVSALDEFLASGGRGEELNIVFAGGIHDGMSAAMVAGLSAGLAERGVAVGVLMGTAYLFTPEAVAAGAITGRFQKEALACSNTVLLETGPGHAIRCIPTPYAETFSAEKHRLVAEGKSPLEVGLSLERMNLGRLRVASKGVDRTAGDASPELTELGSDEQFRRGMYMIGQVAGLRDQVTTIAQLHADVSEGSVKRLRMPVPQIVANEPPAPPPCDVAIVGLSCFYPKANSLDQFWNNILAKVNAVEEVPPSHWDWRPYYDADPRARDKIISKWGGFLSDIPFDPLSYGITPKSMPNIEPMQLLLLEGVRQALADAGYANRPFDRERTAAILGVGGGGAPLSVSYGFRACLPLIDSIPNVSVSSDEVLTKGTDILPEWTEDSFPGILLNVAAGRVANRFNLGGPNMAIDAACGSSLAALYAGVRELQFGTSDMAVIMGADTVQTPFAYVAFSKTHALSPRGRCRPFDAGADGIVLAEGIGVAVLKRLADAERDGDRIYSVIKGVGASSDGRDKGLTAPRAEGQLRALKRAYAQARISPAEVGLVEAHGTGTVVGDMTEAQALGQMWRDAGAAARTCALGSVKSMIGHSKCAAGLAGLIKATLALHHKVLPPTLVEQPNAKAGLADGPLFLNTEARPWVQSADQPRRAGVSAFGFGGTNFHVVLEEHTNPIIATKDVGLSDWPAELLVWRRPDKAALFTDLRQCRDALKNGATPRLAELALSLWRSSQSGHGQPTICIVAPSLADAIDKLDVAFERLAKAETRWEDPRGIFFAEKPSDGYGKIAFLFPGQGSQYPNMLAQLAATFPEVRETFDAAQSVLAGRLGQPLGQLIFPPSTFTPEEEKKSREELQRTEIAQPAVGACGLAMHRLLAALGIEADMFAGHSYGEYVALAAAGSLTPDALIELSHRRGSLIREASPNMPGGMLAVEADMASVVDGLGDLPGVTIANCNSPKQTVLSGDEAGLSAASKQLQAKGQRGRRLSVACGFHSSLVAAAKNPLATALQAARFAVPRGPVYSNTTAKPHRLEVIADQLAEHLVAPVRFQDEIEAMYEVGARVFVEVGPSSVLSGLVQQTLAGKPHLAVASDQKGRSGLLQLCHLLAQLLTHGVPARLDPLFEGRGLRAFDLARLDANTGKPKHSVTTWLVNSVRSRPINGPEPRLLGHAKPAKSEEPRPAAAPAAKLSQKDGVRMKVEEKIPAESLATQTSASVREAAQVMMRFQEVMARFLDTQKSVMTSFLGTSPPTAALPIMPSTKGHSVERNGHTKAQIPVAAPHSANGSHDKSESKPPAPVEPPKAEKSAAPMDREAMLTRLIDLVAERTGYPKESLSIDLDLEADLGIDSIKRVEILSNLADSLGGEADSSTLEMEKLTAVKTLRGIVDFVTTALAKKSATPAPTKATIPTVPATARQADVQRLVVRLVDAPWSKRPSLMAPPGVLLITDDGGGVARELADRLAELDVRTIIVRHQTDASSDRLAADLTDANAVTMLLDRIRKDAGPIAGLIHLLPLAELHDGESRVRSDVFSLYVLARALEGDLRAAGSEGASVLLAATAMGGAFGFEGELPDPFPVGHGAVAGFTKCVSFEWPEVLVRVVDLDPQRPGTEQAERLLAELGDRDGPIEIGYVGSRRVMPQTEPGPVEKGTAPNIEIAPNSTIVITGGARGITAKVAEQLARRFQCNLVLVGRSAPPEQEDPETARLQNPAEIKAALMARFQREGRPAAPASVEAAFQRLKQDREVRDNLAAIRAAGGRVHYHSLDVRDQQAFAEFLKHVADQFGGIDGIIHGAGVIEDRLVKDKTPESFDRVFGTKVDSALTTIQSVDLSRLKFCVFFASLTSRYGNRGQSDYAAANEVLSKIAADLNRRSPGRIVSMAWGPWAGVGMVADLEKHLVKRGLQLITPETGPQFVIDELLYGTKTDHEVIIAGGTEQAAKRSREGLNAAPATVGVG